MLTSSGRSRPAALTSEGHISPFSSLSKIVTRQNNRASARDSKNCERATSAGERCSVLARGVFFFGPEIAEVFATRIGTTDTTIDHNQRIVPFISPQRSEHLCHSVLKPARNLKRNEIQTYLSDRRITSDPSFRFRECP